MSSDDTLKARKKAMREQALANRNAQPDKDSLSRQIWEKLVALPEYQAARSVLWYVDARGEVRTRHCLPGALADEKKIVVPYCVEGQLELFHLQIMDELTLGMYRILEPRPELRPLPDKRVSVGELDLIVVPGVAFDRRGARLGHGFGYYDKLLAQARPDALLVALAFECQVFDEVPMAEHDRYMGRVLTEKADYPGRPGATSRPGS